ncbi:hypothetical protein MAPG_10783 [Magnaporthiopsis poae ATCC 64411]|uniref:Alpha-D-phosphohexomutase alpha/beta/alpha domain-containing protein n=1 Tax=Magnaporthiopsis poae (strain ATCC 64411 / 73-15) TaxID=644358 RepID=A0A0C4EDI3_MAGP6|nr:hypothetical protein MAPG_10783 [Magnaporthiopsis poae ATCC 64411]
MLALKLLEKADLFEGISFRVGLLAALRSRKLGSQAIGVIITASHNPAADNSVPMGEILEQDLKACATAFVNCPTDKNLADTYAKLATKLNIDLSWLGQSCPPNISHNLAILRLASDEGSKGRLAPSN